MKLNDSWKLQYFDVGSVRDLEVASPEYIDYFWMGTRVPGDVHSTLIEKKLIEDPFYGHNDLKCQWIEEKTWWYRTTFTFSEDVSQNDYFELIFEGLDTYATVYLNGVELGSTDNMFIRHTFEVKRELKQGKNVLAIKFDPLHIHVNDKLQYYWAGFSKQRIWTRKAQSHFGWDWGPRLVTTGVWKDVYLEKRTYAKIDNVFAKTASLSKNHAVVEVDIEIDAQDIRKNYEAIVSLSKNGHTFTTKVSIAGNHGSGIIEVANPVLWWTHDLGEPELYQLQVELFVEGVRIDTNQQDFGLRTIEIIQTDQNGDFAFAFVLNGVKMFVKGANWIPIDSFIASTPDSRYKHLITMAKEANMTMLRVWGGGIYERDIFYEACDRDGILVWQDFMFSCALYPDYNKNFMDNVRTEVIQVTKRLRNHACLAIWCGNNENDWLYEALYSSGEITHPFYGEKIYHQLMPELLSKLDPTRLFWPSSPYGGNDHNSRKQGDTHNWQVWHGNIEPRQFGEPQRVDYSVEGISFKNFKQDDTKFASEFGMHASANQYTLKRNIPSDQFYLGSDEMAYRNKDIHHHKGILLMEGYTGVPTNIDEYMSFSMLTQAEGLKFGIEHYRRNQQTSGALIWQLNDCWPGTSWSMIDYYLLPKASYHYAQRFFYPTLLTVDHEPGGDIKLWVVNDRLNDYSDVVEYAVLDFNGQLVYSKKWDVTIAANGVTFIDGLIEKDVLNQSDPTGVCMVVTSKLNRTPRNIYYFRDHKELKLPLTQLSVVIDRQRDELIVSSDSIARMVTIGLDMERLKLSDNYFDLLPNEKKVIKLEQAEGKEIPWDSLKIKAINSINES